MNDTFTKEQYAEVGMMMQRFPFRIVYAMIDKNNGEFFTSAVVDKRIPNKLAKLGHTVVLFSKSN